MEHIVKVNHIITPIEHQKHNIRIISIGDIHFGQKMKIQKVMRAFKLAESLNPDYICLVGDNIDTTNVIDEENKKLEFLELMKYSGSVAPTMVSLADHDQRYRFEDGHTKIDFRDGFWNCVNAIPNVHVLDNSSYEDDKVRFLGYTLPSYYYHGKYELPKYSNCKMDRLDEDVDVLIENMNFYGEMFESYNYGDKYSAVLFHSPQNVDNEDVSYHLRGFDHILSGHMHEGCVPPILDDLIPGNKGIISPQKTLFPGKSRGIIKTGYGSLCIINGGITKIHESANAVLQPFNGVFPMHMDVIDVIPSEEKGKIKEYKKKSYYKYVK